MQDLYDHLDELGVLENNKTETDKKVEEFINNVEPIRKSINYRKTSDDIRAYYINQFEILQTEMKKRPRDFLESYCKNLNLPVGNKLKASLEEKSNGRTMVGTTWARVLNGNLTNSGNVKDRIAALEVPRVLQFGIRATEEWIHSVTDTGFNYNNGLDLIYLFNFACNDAEEPLTDEDFSELIQYYHKLGTRLNKADLNQKVADPEAADNTILNVSSIKYKFKRVAEATGKEAAINEMKEYLAINYPYLDIPSQRCLTIFATLSDYLRGADTSATDPEENLSRRHPYDNEIANHISNVLKNKNTLLYARYGANHEDEEYDPNGDKDLISKNEALKSWSREIKIGNNGRATQTTDVSIANILNGQVKPAKDDMLALVFRCCTKQWLESVQSDNDADLIKDHVKEFSYIAYNCLKYALLPEFEANHRLEMSYLLSVVGFHDGLVVFTKDPRADKGESHNATLTDAEKTLNKSNVAIRAYNRTRLAPIMENEQLHGRYVSFSRDFNAKINNQNVYINGFDCNLGEKKDVFPDEFIDELLRSDAFANLVNHVNETANRLGVINPDAILEATRKHARWTILKLFVDYLLHENENVANFSVKIDSKKNLKVTFKIKT